MWNKAIKSFAAAISTTIVTGVAWLSGVIGVEIGIDAAMLEAAIVSVLMGLITQQVTYWAPSNRP